MLTTLLDILAGILIVVGVGYAVSPAVALIVAGCLLAGFSYLAAG